MLSRAFKKTAHAVERRVGGVGRVVPFWSRQRERDGEGGDAGGVGGGAWGRGGGCCGLEGGCGGGAGVV